MDVKLPKLGEGADSGVVVNIMVKEGDVITKGQTLIELENEKAVAPIPATSEGKVTSIRVKEGDRISVGHVILTLEGGNGQPGASPVAKPSAAQPARPKSAPPVGVRVRDEGPSMDLQDYEDTDEPDQDEGGLPPAAAPSLRRIARELGIDLRKIRGSENGGRIVMADVRAYIARLTRLAAQSKAQPAHSVAAAPVAPAPESIDFSKWGSVTKAPLTQLRKTISRRMVENWNAIPHVTQFEEADLSRVLELRKKYVAAYEAKGARLTVTTFALKAVARTLAKHPLFNSSIDESTQELVTKQYFHIGLAVDTDAGLIVPVIRDVDKKDLVQISKDVTDVADRARDRKLGMEDLKGGTFTISNQGGIGGAHFTPIVNKPELAILGLGKGSMKAVVRGTKIEPRMMLPVCISYDHRVIDGGNAARFTVDLIKALEEFSEDDVKI